MTKPTAYDQLQVRLSAAPHTWLVTPNQWANFSFIRGDICNIADCQKVCEGVDYVIHQAALGSASCKGWQWPGLGILGRKY